MSADPWTEEQERQSRELTDILNNQIMAFGDRLKASGKQPMLNAVASAIVSITAHMLASVEDRHVRKELRKAMERNLTVTVAAHEGRAGRTPVIVVRGRLNS